MISYYTLTKGLYDHLITDEDITTCVIGALDDVDINKQTVFPLAHIFVGSATLKGGTVSYPVTISTMDLLDIKKDNPIKGEWKGQDNKQYILNTMLAVHENLRTALDKGSFQSLGWELIGDYNCEAFEDRFENLLTGWSASLTIEIPNTVQNCG